MNTREQEYMLALDKTRSITRAAEQLHVTQPTLSLFLTNLEKRLGTPLFHRLGKKLVPTQVGEAYLRRAQQIMALKYDFEMEMSDLISGRQGKLYLGGLRKGNLFLMPRLIRQFRMDYPGVDVILHEDTAENLENALSAGELDLIYVNQPPTHSGLHVEQVRQDHMLMVLPADHPAVKRSRWLEGCHYPYLDLHYVEQEAFYLLEEGRTIRTVADEALRYSGVTPHQIYLISNIELGCQMAAEGLGVAFTMESYRREFDYPHPVSYFRVGDPEFSLSWNLMWRKEAFRSTYMDDFIQLLKQLA